jgi:NAD(P)H-nitrite reductase large subunit
MRYVIIGVSAAGTAAARAIRQHDADGEIVLVGRDPQVYSRCQLHLVAAGHRSPERANFLPELWAASHRVDLHLRRDVEGIDSANRVVRTDDGAALPYDRLLIATGSRTFIPPVPGLIGPRTYGFRNLDDALAIRAELPQADRFVIVGAGLAGCELACELAGLGKQVSLVELAPHPLPLQLEELTGAMCARRIRELGVDLHCADPVSEVRRDEAGNPRSVVLGSGKELPADVVVAVAGVMANVELGTAIGAKAGRGLAIDAQCRTTVPGVYAAGDVTETEDTIVRRTMPSAIWPAAIRQGEVAGISMAGGSDSLTRNTGFRASVCIGGTSIVSLGAVSMADKEGWQKQVFQYTNSRGETCAKVLYRDGSRLMAAVLWGDITNAGVYGETIINGRDITGDMPYVSDLDGAKRGVQKLVVS